MMENCNVIDLKRRRIIVGAGIAVTIAIISSRKTFAQVLVPDDSAIWFQHFDASVGTGGTYIIEGVNFRLIPNMMQGDHHMIVRADTLEIADALSLPGFDITLVARVLKCGPNAAISTKGRDGKNANTSPAGEGKDGANGSPGASGGNIHVFADEFAGQLLLDTSGGKGGDAQSGGHGTTGGVGVAATSKTRGGAGQRGGAGGLAGVPGQGGDSGSVIFSLLEGFPPQTVSVVQNQGRPGTPGSNGGPGDGGPGGQPFDEYDNFAPSPRCPV
jgi:hypothetical protein